MPNSGAHDDHTAPRLAVARNATRVSGMFGEYATTRSPRWTPWRCNPARHRASASASSAHDSRLVATTRRAAQRVLRVVERRALEPARARHVARPQGTARFGSPDRAG